LSFEKKNIEHGGRMTFSQIIGKILRQNEFGLRKKQRKTSEK